jgi:hypothetical protein
MRIPPLKQPAVPGLQSAANFSQMGATGNGQREH